MTISEHAITASLTPPNTTCGATTAHSEDSLCLGPQPAVSGAGDLNISFSPRTAQLFAESAGATPQFASFGSIPMVEDQKTAMTTPMASSSWKRNSKDIPTGLGHDEGSSVPYWDPNVSAIPVCLSLPLLEGCV